MSTNDLSRKVETLIVKHRLYLPLLNSFNQGLILCETDTFTILYINDMARETLTQAGMGEITMLTQALDEEEISAARQGEYVRDDFGKKVVKLVILQYEDYLWVAMTDCTEAVKMEDTSKQILEMNKEFRDFFNEYGDENVVIANKDGIIEYAGEDIARTCGVGTDFFVGKSVYDVERKKIFYPSVTARVLVTKDVQVILQKTRNNEELVSVGAPIFDAMGNIEKVVSITKDFSKQLKLSSMMVAFAESEMVSPNHGDELRDFVTCSEKMIKLKLMMKLVAPTTSTILINGETGTGKEVIARNIAHLSNRKDKPFIKVNCGTISPNLVESELFGYEPGSFTGASKEGKIGLMEAAHGGTVFLDEVSELPMEQQVKLLHVLQEKILIRVGGTKPVDLDIRVIAATNKKLEELVEEGMFREDLYYRLNVVPINIPPLRERKEDIPLLIKYFLEQFNQAHGRSARISKNAMDTLHKYTWPGNVRELENTIERLVVTATQNNINEEVLPDKIKQNIRIPKDVIQVNAIMHLSEALEETERKLIEMAIKECGTTVGAAVLLGVNQSTISRKLAQFGLKEYLHR